jgi:proteasome lid subunit RPN8/RPN11
MANRRKDRCDRRFLIGPADVTGLERRARASGLEVLGYYHSHPDGPPLPSAYDQEHAWPWYVHLIVSVRLGSATGVRAWRLAAGNRRLEPIRLFLEV